MVCELPTLCQATTVLTAFFIGKFLLFKLLAKYREGKNLELHNKEWKKDVVYLYQFPRAPVVPNLSPFCLKLETWLRANDIKYEVVPTFTLRSSKGLLPFIELNGKQIADSQMIVFELSKYFKVESNLTREQQGVARAVDRLIDGSTFFALIYSKVFENGAKFVSSEVSGLPLHGPVAAVAGYLFGQKALAGTKKHGIGNFSADVVYDQVRRDLAAVDGILGDKLYLVGHEPSIADFTLFGHLASCYFLPYNQPMQDMLNHEFPRVLELLKRMRNRYWADWENLS